ncbi:MAG: O-antigen ligase family protein [Patescibacteria group bacterium]|jgi:O-antigen ligase
MKAINLDKKIPLIVLGFFLFQILSFLGYLQPILANIIFILIVLSAIFLSVYKIEYGFLILIFEFLSGHGGLLFEFKGISLRLTLFAIVMLVWAVKKFFSEKWKKLFSQKKSPFYILFLVFLILILFGLIQGIIRNHGILAVKDFINYSYFLLLFPLIDVLKKEKFDQNVFSLAQGATIGIGISTIIVLILFGSGLVQVHNSFYWWWRSVAVGKATYMNGNFFRIVTPAHLLILPLFLIYLSLLFETKLKLKKQLFFFWLASLSGLTILINFSRAYFLGFFAGLIFLAKELNRKKWMLFSLSVILILIFEFCFIYTLFGGMTIFKGLDFFKDRLGTIISPQEETSSLTRMVILPLLAEKIKADPIFGSGLGATVSYLDPATNQMQSTFHLDWGYFEIWMELGLIGLLAFLSLLGSIFYQGFQTIKIFSQDIFKKRIVIGLIGGVAALMVASLTGPFIFHPLGILYLTFTAAYLINLNRNERTNS